MRIARTLGLAAIALVPALRTRGIASSPRRRLKGRGLGSPRAVARVGPRVARAPGVRAEGAPARPPRNRAAATAASSPWGTAAPRRARRRSSRRSTRPSTRRAGARVTRKGARRPAYLGGADPYATVKAFKGIIVSDPSASILMTKGQHEGPDLANPLRGSINTWLTAEAAAFANAARRRTRRSRSQTGANTVDLSTLGVSGFAQFSASSSGDILTLSGVALKAPTAMGVEAQFPSSSWSLGRRAHRGRRLLERRSDGGCQDRRPPSAPASSSCPAGRRPTSSRSAFNKLAPATSTDGGLTGACKSVTSVHHERRPRNQSEHVPQLPQHRRQRERGARPLGPRGDAGERHGGVHQALARSTRPIRPRATSSSRRRAVWRTTPSRVLLQSYVT